MEVERGAKPDDAFVHLQWQLPLGHLPLFRKRKLGSLPGKDSLPVVLHTDDSPAPLRGFIQGPVELAIGRLAIIGELAFPIVVVDDQAQTLTEPAGGPFEHLEVSVRVTERGDRAAADM